MLEPCRVERRRVYDRRAAPRTGFGSVRAVVEPALRRQRLDVGEHTTQTVVRVPQRDRTQSGRVDEPHRRPAAARARARSWCAVRADRSRARRRSPAPARRRAAFTSVDLPTPDAPMSATVRRPRRARAAPRVRSGHRARHDDVELRRGLAPRPRPRGRPGSDARSAFDKRRQGPRRSRTEHELALEPAEVRPVVQRLHDEHHVDVRGDDLGAARGASKAPN